MLKIEPLGCYKVLYRPPPSLRFFDIGLDFDSLYKKREKQKESDIKREREQERPTDRETEAGLCRKRETERQTEAGREKKERLSCCQNCEITKQNLENKFYVPKYGRKILNINLLFSKMEKESYDVHLVY